MNSTALRRTVLGLPRATSTWPLARRVAVGILALYALVAIFAPWIAPIDPTRLDPALAGQPPSGAHLFGTDSLGYDVFSRVVFATRIDLLIAVLGVVSSVTVGVALGVVAGFGPRWGDALVMRSADVLQGFPRFVLALAVAYSIGPGIPAILVATGILNVPVYARVTRAMVRSVRQSDFVIAARAIGLSEWRIAWRHVLPNATGPVLVQAALQPGWIILEAAGLSFIGLGVQEPTPEWGLMLSSTVSEFFHGYWWTYLFPGLALAGAVLAFNLLGESFNESADGEPR